MTGADTVKCFMGIDPGLGGGIAFYFPAKPDFASVYDMPVAGKEIDVAGIARLVAQYMPDAAFVEAVHAMPRQGVSSTFRFGVAYGAVLGVLGACHIATHLVTPKRWQKHFHLIGGDKEQSRALALRLFPARAELFAKKKNENRAEAVLIARYGAETSGDIK